MSNPTHPNFKPHEFACKCGCGLGFEDMKPSTLKKLYKARDIAGIGFVITSAIRCDAHNLRVGGANNSAHRRGYAVDIAATDSHRRYKIFKALLEAGFPRAGINFSKLFVHVDDDPSLPPEVLFPY